MSIELRKCSSVNETACLESMVIDLTIDYGRFYDWCVRLDSDFLKKNWEKISLNKFDNKLTQRKISKFNPNSTKSEHDFVEIIFDI